MSKVGLFFSTLLLAVVVSTAALAATSRDELVIANFRDLRDLNPHLYGGELFAQNLLFEGLVFLGQDGKPQPWLAKSWTVSPDGTLYTFKLRDDVKFSDGTKFDAHTAKENFDALLDNGSRHGWLESVRLMMEVIKSGKDPVRAIDDYTLEIEFSKPYFPFIIELGVTRPFRMLSPACFKDGTTKNGTACLVGTGSYLLKTNKIDEHSEFVRNPLYYGKQPAIEKIVAKVVPDNQARLLALENGEIDMIYGTNLINPKAYERFSQKKGFGGALSNPVSTRMMILNTTSKNLSDVRVRQALQHLTNKQIISDKIMLGLEAPADTLFAKSIPYADIDLKAYDYNIAKAAELLDAAGWKMDGKVRKKDGRPLEITLTYDSDKVIEKTIAQYLQSVWGKAGVKMNIVGEEEQAHRDRLKAGDFDLSFNISWGTPYDPQSFLGAMRKPVYGDYVAQQGLKDKQKLDAAILKALEAVDMKERQAHFTYIFKTLHHEAVYLPLTYERNRAIFSDKVQSVGFNPSQFEIPMQRMKLK
jgi:nickel transport system substrate-binding protein